MPSVWLDRITELASRERVVGIRFFVKCLRFGNVHLFYFPILDVIRRRMGQLQAKTFLIRHFTVGM